MTRRVLRACGGMEAGDTMAKKRDGNILGNKPSFASVLHEESRRRKWTPSSMVKKEELTHSSWHLHYVRFVYYRHMYANLRAMDYTRTLVDTRADRALKNTMVILVPDPIGPLGSKKGTTGNHNLLEHQMPKSAYQKKTTRTPVSNPFSALEEDNEKSMDDLVDYTRKKMEAHPKKTPRKTCIWSGRKADSPKRNAVFSLKTKVHYFDKDDMDFDDMGQKVEEVEHMNAYSEND
ncbi:hypothetical protein Tco_0583092 [Tanacetum coccineum]